MSATEQEWLESFFSADNGWSLDKIKAGGYPPILQAHLESMLAPCLISEPPFIVPRLDENKRLWFYIIGSERRELDEFLRIAKAFVGGVRTLIDPRVFVSTADAGESVLLDKYPHGFGKLYIPNELNSAKNEVYEVMKSLNLAVAQYKRRPPGLSTTRRPTGKVLSDFFIAYGRNDGEKALEYAEELRLTGDLSPRNFVAIELQALAAGNQWVELLGHAHLHDMLQGRISTFIQNAVLDAVRNSVLQSERPTDHDVASIEASLRDLATLFLRVPHLDSSAETSRWKVWALGAAVLGHARVLDEIPKDAIDQEWLRELAEWAELTPSDTQEATTVLSIFDAEPSLESAVALLQQSLTVNQGSGRRIFRRLSEFPVEVFDSIEEHRQLQSAWETLRSEYEESSGHNNWHSWLQSLSGGPVREISEQSLIEICQSWSASDWNEDKVSANLYDLVDSKNAMLVRNTIPIMRKWLQDHEISISARFVELQVIMLAIDDVYSIQDLALYAELVSDLLGAPHTEQQYVDAVDSVGTCWDRVKSVRGLDYALETMDILLDSPCANEQSRLAFWNAIQQFCISNWERLTPELQLLVLRSAEDTVSTKQQFPPLSSAENESAPQRPSLTGKKLAIYTLTEGAARRARAVLSELFPAVEIRLNHDKTATAELVNLAETADYFVFSSRSAAHQAFYPVTKRRADILYPTGKGSSSIVRCFLEAIQSETH